MDQLTITDANIAAIHVHHFPFHTVGIATNHLHTIMAVVVLAIPNLEIKTNRLHLVHNLVQEVQKECRKKES